MSWWGKLLGGTFGFMLGGPIGALAGAALGHSFDRGLSRADQAERLADQGFDQQDRAQTAFFTATFAVMGHVAKADGRVTSDEINLASRLMDHLGLRPQLRDMAKHLFNEGKAANFDLDGVLSQFKRECRNSRNLRRMFLEVQLQAAYADHELHPKEQEVLDRIRYALGLSQSELETIEALVRAGMRHGSSGQGAGWGPGSGAEPGGAAVPRLEDDYTALELRPSATDQEVKRAYRRMMARHHPDKLIAKGLPEEMVKVATEKTQDIKAAYERIRSSRRP